MVIWADVAEVGGVFAKWQSTTTIAVAVVCELWDGDVKSIVLWCVVEGHGRLVQWERTAESVDSVHE